VVLASHYFEDDGLPSPFAYFIEFDAYPGIPALTGGHKLELVPG
jgi:hypothetical protein